MLLGERVHAMDIGEAFLRIDVLAAPGPRD
jgi:hypothetical protein